MSVNFIIKENPNTVYRFICSMGNIIGFCGGNYYFNFSLGVGADPYGNSTPVPVEGLLAQLIQEWRPMGCIGFFDIKNGYADSYIFRHVPASRRITVDGQEYDLNLSHYYVNRNSGNHCRHLIVTRI